MNKKLLFFFLGFLMICNRDAKADEGMWLPMLIDRLNYVDMQKMGLQLTAAEIYSVNNSSLKDAIVQFNGGCTGEIISKDGLLITNHHCGFSAIQSQSSVQNDYLTNGFWSMKKEDELPIEGLFVTFLIRIEDVTAKVLKDINSGTSEADRNTKIKAATEKISAEAITNSQYTSEVKSFFEGNEYYLFVYEVFNDVRLVGAPPSAIGAFGGDTDNWMWPRHTCDFSMFRVYMAPDGKNSKYSKNNIPIKPKSFLPISLNGAKVNDFTMILGYPGKTDRYLTSYGVDMAISQTNPSIVKIREQKLQIMKSDMIESDEVRIKYASKYAQTSNYWKYYIGQTKGLKRLDVFDKKKNTEDAFQKWAVADPERNAKYGAVITELKNAFDIQRKYNLFRWYYRETIIKGTDIIPFAFKFLSLFDALNPEKPNPEKVLKLKESFKSQSIAYFKDFNLATDKKVFSAMLKLFYEDVPADQHPTNLTEIHKKYKGDFKKFADVVYNKSIFANSTKLLAFLDKPDYKTLSNDLAFKLMDELFEKFKDINKISNNAYEMQLKGNRLYVAGLKEMNPDKKYYPNANSTMRLSYGKVLDYYPSDAVSYNYFTTLDGIIQKEDPKNEDFIVPAKLKELYNLKDYGRYVEDGTIKACFLTNNDITGGNSGSPVINGKGQLLGLAFDGNWEAMSGDIAYEPELQRTIVVDIRYILFIIEKYAGATNLINEMSLVDNKIKDTGTIEIKK